MDSRNYFSLSCFSLLAAGCLIFTGCAGMIGGAKEEATEGAKSTMEAKDSVAQMPQKPMSEKEIQEQMAKASAPDVNHKLLAGLAGTWNAEVKMFMDAKAEPKVSKAKVTSKVIMEGRFVETSHQGKMMGKPFMGRAITGYDKQSGKFVEVWFDNMSTSIMKSVGQYNPENKTFTYNSEMTCPMTSEKIPVRYVVTVMDKNKHKFEWFETRNGQEQLGMEILYSRVR